MVLWRSRAAPAPAPPPPAEDADDSASSSSSDGGGRGGDGGPSSSSDYGGRIAASSLGSASEFCARNGLTDGGPASAASSSSMLGAMGLDDLGIPRQHWTDDGGVVGDSVVGGNAGGMGTTGVGALPGEAVSGLSPLGGGYAAGGAAGAGPGGDGPPPLFPPLGATAGGAGHSGGGVGTGGGGGGSRHPRHNYPGSKSTGGIWPPAQEKAKKMKRDRSGNQAGAGMGAGAGGGGAAGGGVTRIDVYPNGESYVTSPDGTTTKTVATISPSNADPPIFQFTSNTAAAAGGGGGPPSAAAAALSFGRGFAPGAGARGVATPAPGASSSSFGNGGGGGGTASSSSSLAALDDAGGMDGMDGDSLGPLPDADDYDYDGGEGTGGGGNGSSRSSLPSSPWRPQSSTSTCEFTHTIANYAQKRDSGCKKAEYSGITTDSHGNKWRLIVYVNGNGRASNHHLSLFLQVADAEELPFGWNKAVSYVLTLEHPRGQNLGYAKRNPDKTFKLCPKAIDWGWSQFITSDRIQQEGYVDRNALTVRASVTVKSSSVRIDPEDAELYLKCAVEEGNADAVKICLAQEARVNCQFKDDLYTPLHTACSANNHGDGERGSGGSHTGNGGGSSSSSPTNSGSPPPGPISPGSLEVLDLLLERGADVNACNKWRETPLLIAANNGHVEAVKRLLLSGADPSLCSEAGWSALTFAAHKGYDDICGLLLSARAPVNCRVAEDLSTPLHKACAGSKSGHVSAVRQLLAGDADVHALNKWRETPLLTAANHGQDQAVEALLRYGADPCKCTDTGWSPLSIAAYKGHDEVVRLLLEEGAPTEEDDPTLSALLQAATKGLPDTVMLLLRHGADHTVTTKKGDTALSILVEQNLIDAAVEMATDFGASVPRCSRDRKKVQRARLLINLRLKQMQREGTGPYGDRSDDSDDGGESDDGGVPENGGAGGGRRFALHDDPEGGAGAPPLGSTPRSKKKRDKGRGTGGGGASGGGSPPMSIAKAEADARAAEEALLLELDAEEARASKQVSASGEGGGESSKNRKKKMKKREKERQHRLAEQAREEEALEADRQRREESKAREAATAASAVSKQGKKAPSSPGKKENSSLAKKEKVVDLTSQTAALKGKKRQDGISQIGLSAKKVGPGKEVSLPSVPKSTAVKPLSAQDKKKAAMAAAAAAESKLNLKWAEGKDREVKPRRAREVSISSSGKADTVATKKASSAAAHHRNKANHHKGTIMGKKIPGDNPVAPRKIPGDNPVAPRKIPGDNPVAARKIPGDNPVPQKKIPGDNPKVPIQQPQPQQSRPQGALQKGGIGGGVTLAKNKRGWESKSPPSQPPALPAPIAIPKKAPKQQQQLASNQTNAIVKGQGNKEKSSGKKASVVSLPAAPSKSPPAAASDQTPSPTNRVKQQQKQHQKQQQQQQPQQQPQHPTPDESTQSTANSTAETSSLPATPTPQKRAVLGSAASNVVTAATTTVASPVAQQTPLISADMSRRGSSDQKVSVDDQLANMANDVLGFLDFDQPGQNDDVSATSSGAGYPSAPPTSRNSSTTPPPSTNMQGGAVAASLSPPVVASPAQPPASSIPVELPSVSIYRLEKLNELFRRCAEARSSSSPSNNDPLRVVGERMLRVVLYRWIIRASHGAELFLDPVIPSWKDEAYLREFTQRQFISESRRSVPAGAAVPGIEVLRDAGATVSEICMQLARGVVEFRSKCEEQVPADWSDAIINVAGVEEGNDVIIDWSGKSRLSIPFGVFHSLARRYVGERGRLMSAIFSAVRRHEIMVAIADQTDMICHLPSQTMDGLTRGLGASLETWSDSISVYGDSYFCATFPDVDTAFGGLPPFGREKGGGESLLLRSGGSAIVVAPPENATSSQVIRRLVDMSETSAGLPLSFGVVMSSDCFVNANNVALTMEDLRALDPRLCEEKKGIISFAEVVPAGSCSFSKSSSMFLLIQNDAGKLNFPTHPAAMDMIRRSMRSDLGTSSAQPMMSSLPAMPNEAQFDAAPFSPMSQQYSAGAQEVPLSSNPWGGAGGNRAGRGHRGRLFELVGDEDAEEDQNMNNILPGMLDSLNMNMFGGSTASDEVDIEAISLMGIGLNGSTNSNYSKP